MSSSAPKKAPPSAKAPGNGHGIDSLVSKHGKHLKTGEEVRFVLIKGPNRVALVDPVNPKAPSQEFPLVAKFSESVVKPDFSKMPWSTARLYQQDIPKAQDDSDEEEDADGQPKKRWRARNQKEVGRQWILQEEVEFLEAMMAKRQKAKTATTGTTDGDADEPSEPTTSTKYEGLPEHNPSRYILLETATTTSTTANGNGAATMSSRPPQNIQVTLLPTPFGTINFSQPKATNAMSMSQAVDYLEDQRGKVTRFMMHDQQRIFQGQAPVLQSRTRLLGKLMAPADGDDAEKGISTASGGTKKKSSGGSGGSKRKRWDADDDDEDDVMGDLRFQKRGKGSSAQSKARQELLQSFGDGGTKVDADFVLGGANDSMFQAKGQRFGQLANDTGAQKDPKDDDGHGAESAPGASEERGNAGNAMADDFYQRDVQAEYEELDYDANEQFDDDDVDVGETEVGITDAVFNEEEDDDDLEDADDGERLTGAEGLASAKGFEILLKKARGELTSEQAAEEAAKSKRQAEEADKRLADIDQDGDSDHLSKILEAAEKAKQSAEERAADNGTADGETKKVSSIMDEAVQVDDNGQRVISLNQVRREIWLNHGRIPMKRLMKIFDVKKKSSQDRQNKFREAVRELCTMETDPVGGRTLVLKQHYSNMG